MKGKIIKSEDYQWLVTYIAHNGKTLSLQLHPDDIENIVENSKIFDNIESRILSYPDVEFEIVRHQKMDGYATYAKLIKN